MTYSYTYNGQKLKVTIDGKAVTVNDGEKIVSEKELLGTDYVGFIPFEKQEQHKSKKRKYEEE